MSDNDENKAKNVSEAKPSRFNAWLKRATALFMKLPLPGRIALAATAIGAIIAIGYFSIAPRLVDYKVLYTELEAEDAGAIVEELKKREAKYRLKQGGSTIEVEADRVHDLRLEMASAGLPRQGQAGFDSFQNIRLGASELERQVAYRRAMEAELARTISAMRNVKSTRVHLVLPKKSVFTSQVQPSTASVVVKLTPGKQLERENITGILHLVASAVPNLKTSQVTLVTANGQVLHRGSEDGDADSKAQLDAAQDAIARNYEKLLRDRARAMLERVLGPGHVDVRVQATIDSAKIERKSDSYDKSKAAMRSEQMLLEGTSANVLDDTVAGVPGAESNLPQGADGRADQQPETTPADDKKLWRRRHTRNYEISHVQERRVSTKVEVKRVAVAVVVDGLRTVNGKPAKARSREELDKLATLVKSAIGFDAGRGDIVTIESIPFHSEPMDVPKVAAPSAAQQLQARWKELAAAGALLALLTIALLIRRRRRKRREAEEAARVAAANAARRTEEEEAAAIPMPHENVIDYREEARKRAKEDPATAALVVRRWLDNSSDSEAA